MKIKVRVSLLNCWRETRNRCDLTIFELSINHLYQNITNSFINIHIRSILDKFATKRNLKALFIFIVYLQITISQFIIRRLWILTALIIYIVWAHLIKGKSLIETFIVWILYWDHFNLIILIFKIFICHEWVIQNHEALYLANIHYVRYVIPQKNKKNRDWKK